jgi:UDP-N-acetylglucosamine 3-dehydrogenase
MAITPVTPVTGRPIRLAVVGAGSMGMNHVRVVRDFPDDAVELVGVAEPHAPTLARVVSRYHVAGSPEYRALLDQTRPDVVAVVVPTHLHYEVAAYALDAGLHVLVEKPIATTAEEALALIDLARVRGVHLVVGHVERSNPAILELKRRLDGGALGRLYSLQARRLGPFPPRIREVGVILDLATHDLDAMRYLTGSEVVHLFAEAQQRLRQRHEDLLLGVTRFANDALGLLDVNWLTPTKVRELSVTGERGMFLVNYLTQDLYFYENDYSATTWEALRTTAGVSEGTMTRLKVQKAEPLRLEYENLLAAVRGEAAPRVTGEDGLVVLRLAQQLVQAAQTREVVACGVPTAPAR